MCTDLVAERAVTVEPSMSLGTRHLLRAHGLSGLAVAAADAGEFRVDGDTLDGIRRDWDGCRAWSLAVDRETTRFSDIATRAQRDYRLARPIILKGPAVARHYRRPELRSYLDVDVLIPSDEMVVWAAVLRAMGLWAPAPEVKATADRQQHAVAFRRVGVPRPVSIDLHTCMFVARGARDITYERLVHRSEKVIGLGYLALEPAAQLFVLALHFAQHPAGVQRLIWARDFLELGNTSVVSDARALAREHGASWCIEAALLRVEQVFGAPVWDAKASAPPLSTLTHVHSLERADFLHHVAVVSEFGPWRAGKYFVSRVTPQRYARVDGRIDWRSYRRNLRRAWRTAGRTRWLDLLGKRVGQSGERESRIL